MKKPDWLCLPWVSKTLYYPLFTTLNVMGGFFLFFDVTMDIFHGKFILGQSGHTHHANYPFSTVKVSRITAPIVKLFYEKTYRTVRHARIQSN